MTVKQIWPKKKHVHQEMQVFDLKIIKCFCVQYIHLAFKYKRSTAFKTVLVTEGYATSQNNKE